MSNAASSYIIGRMGQVVAIREVPADEGNFTKRAAWELAQRLAAPAKAAKDPRAKQPNSIEVIGLNGMTTVVQTVEATQAAWEAARKPVPVTTPIVDEPAAPVAGRCSDKQYNFITRLATERNLPVPARESITEASALIKDLLATPRPVTVRQEQPKTSVPAGRYAVDGDDGTTKFYKIDKPTDGKWAGYTFLKVLASDTEYPIKGGAKAAIMAKIEIDPKAAMIRYGQEIGKCGHCNRTLTDEASRAAGIGPVCAEKGGF